MAQRNSIILIVLAFVLGAAGTAVVMSRRPSSSPGESKPEKASEKPVEEVGGGLIKLSTAAMETAGIRIETARIAPIGESLSVPGTVEVSPSRGAKVTPPAPGKVLRLLASSGDSVSAGQPLAILQSFEVAQAQAAVRQAESGVKQAQATAQTSAAETSQARSGVSIAEAEVTQARIKLSSAEQALGRQKELASAGVFSQAPLQAAQQELTESQSELITAQKDDAAQDVVFARAQRLYAAELVSKQELDQEKLRNEQAQIRVERARSRLELSQKAYAREKRIAEAGLLNAREVQTAEAEVRSARADVFKAQQGVSRARQDVRRAMKGQDAAGSSLRGAEAALGASRANLAAVSGNARTGQNGEITVIAPIGGTVAERPVTTGEAVERTATLFVIESLTSVSVVAQVPEKEAARVRNGQPVEVTVAAYPRGIFRGSVQTIGSRVDEKTRALPVRCVVENRGSRLRPEMFARVSLTVGSRSNAVVLPVSALDEHGSERSVFVAKGEGFGRRIVQIGRRTDSTVEVLSGVKAGERVAVEGVFVLESESRKGELKEED